MVKKGEPDLGSPFLFELALAPSQTPSREPVEKCRPSRRDAFPKEPFGSAKVTKTPRYERTSLFLFFLFVPWCLCGK